MIKFFSVIFLFLTLGCSFNQNSKIWNQKDQKSYDKQKVKKIFQDQKKIIKEFNPFLRLEISNKIMITRQSRCSLCSRTYKTYHA